jgi:pimeloyl-ACP methyl ester carboxylesterase
MRQLGAALVCAPALVLAYYSVWVLVLPLVEEDQPLQRLFPARHWAVALPAVAGCAFLLAVGIYTSLQLLLQPGDMRRDETLIARPSARRSARSLAAAALMLRGTAALDASHFIGRLAQLPASAGALPAELFLPVNWALERRTPLLVFLHGRGECGAFDVTNAQSLPLQLLTNASFSAALPLAVLVPQCPWECAEENGWGDAVLAETTALIGLLQRELGLDPQRTLLAGQSMGGNGAWMYAAQQRRLFAATVVVCGYAQRRTAPVLVERLRHHPVAVYHSADDVVIPVDASDEMVRLLRAAGSEDVRYVRYDTAPGPPMPEYAHLRGHGAYELVFRDASLYAWLLNQSCAGCGPQATRWLPLHESV